MLYLTHRVPLRCPVCQTSLPDFTYFLHCSYGFVFHSFVPISEHPLVPSQPLGISWMYTWLKRYLLVPPLHCSVCQTGLFDSQSFTLWFPSLFNSLTPSHPSKYPCLLHRYECFTVKYATYETASRKRVTYFPYPH